MSSCFLAYGSYILTDAFDAKLVLIFSVISCGILLQTMMMMMMMMIIIIIIIIIITQYAKP